MTAVVVPAAIILRSSLVRYDVPVASGTGQVSKPHESGFGGGGGAMTKVKAVLGGCMGAFVEVFNTAVPDLQTAKQRPGFVRLRGAQVETKLMLDDATGREIVAPRAVAGASEATGILCLDIVTSSTTRAYSGNRVSYSTHSFDTLLADLDIFELRSIHLSDVAARFRGEFTNAWAGVDTASTEITYDEESRVGSVSIDLRSLPGASAAMDDQTLELRPRWTVRDTPDGTRSIDIALEVRLAAERPKDAGALLAVLFRVQELLSIAFNGFLPASSGSAACVGPSDRAELWSRTLMHNTSSPRAKPGFRTDFLFSLDQLGGVAGVVRWIELCNEHPRAVAPVINRIRVGRTGADVHLMELCAAIEYWVAARRRNEPDMGRGKRYLEPLAISLGPVMAQWVGDVHRWSTLVWEYYEGPKHHIPGFTHDPRTLRVLTQSTYFALVAALLNRAAMSTSPGDALLADHRLAGTGEAIRALWTETASTGT